MRGARLRIANPQNALFGLFLLVLGGGGVVFGRGLDIGTTLDMGPGSLPMMLSGALLLMGAGFLVSAVATDGPSVGRVAWIPLLVVTGAIVLFGLSVRVAGLAATVVATVLVARLAAPDRRWREAGFYAVALAVYAVVVFRYLLNVPLPVWPQW